MTGQQICLKWNSFQSNIVTCFENLWEEEGLVDCTLASEGQCIRAHKVILSACSPFFRRIFETNPCQHPVVILQDVQFTDLEALLCFVYKGEVNIDQDDLPALLKAAESLQIRGLCTASTQGKVKHSLIPTDSGPPPKKKRPSSACSSLPPLAALPVQSAAQSPSSRTQDEVEERSSSPLAAIIPKTELCSDATFDDSESLASLPLEESMDEGTPEELQKLMQRQGEKLSLAEINQLKGCSDDEAPIDAKVLAPCQVDNAEGGGGADYERLPYACLLPSKEILATWATGRTLEQLGCDLMKLLFTTEERLLCNVNGKMGKRQFNTHKIQLIREVLDHFSGMTPAEFDEQWKSCVTKIDTANRGLKRNLVLKGRKTPFLL